MELSINPMLLVSWTGVLQVVMVTLFILTCLLLMAVVLLQKGRGGGLSSAFGGAMGSSPFGTKTGDVFTWVTVVLAAVFLGCALVLTGLYVPERPNIETPVVAPQPAATQPDQTAQPPAGVSPAEIVATTTGPAEDEDQDGAGVEVVVPVAPAAPRTGGTTTQPDGQ